MSFVPLFFLFYFSTAVKEKCGRKSGLKKLDHESYQNCDNIFCQNSKAKRDRFRAGGTQGLRVRGQAEGKEVSGPSQVRGRVG